jgi:hypothetical protein
MDPTPFSQAYASLLCCCTTADAQTISNKHLLPRCFQQLDRDGRIPLAGIYDTTLLQTGGETVRNLAT